MPIYEELVFNILWKFQFMLRSFENETSFFTIAIVGVLDWLLIVFVWVDKIPLWSLAGLIADRGRI